MENETWIKLYRKLLQSPIFENEKALKVWIWCLIKATHTEREQLVGQQIVHLEKGQFVTGRKVASEELKMKDRTVYDYFKLLEQLSMISIKSNNKFSVITVEKWEDYQGIEAKKQQQSNNKSTTDQQQTNTNKNVKNIYLFILNKYKRENRDNFNEYIKTVSKMKQDPDWDKLNFDEQQKLISEI